MLRSILATLAGLIAAILVVAMIELAGNRIWPAPVEIHPDDPESIRAAMESMPLGALLSVAVAWVAGAFIGAWVAARISFKRWPGWIVGGLIALASVSNLIFIPHPWWFWIAALGLVPLAAWWATRQAWPGNRAGAE